MKDNNFKTRVHGPTCDIHVGVFNTGVYVMYKYFIYIYIYVYIEVILLPYIKF